MPGTSILGIGLAVPDHVVPQERCAEFLVQVAEAQPLRRPGLSRNIERVARRAGIRTRHSVLPDYARTPEGFAFFPSNWALDPFPTTAQRMEVYEREAVALAERAARSALAEARVTPSDVTHLVLTTCTGFFAPGPDIELVRRLGLPPTVRRTLIGFMGCYAGFNGLRTADDIVRADPSAVVLQVSVELCTLHLQRDANLDTAISNLLFADGAAAATYARGEGRAEIAHTASQLAPDSADQMSWHVRDHGFVMRLAATVPDHLDREVPGFVQRLCSDGGLRAAQVGGWGVHPGGRRILEVVGGLLDTELPESFDVLRDYGNMSSATIFFVLDRLLRSGRGPVAALGFGPGLTMEGALLRCGSCSTR
jgi:predicted naringenin-chalcone synthase